MKKNINNTDNTNNINNMDNIKNINSISKCKAINNIKIINNIGNLKNINNLKIRDNCKNTNSNSNCISKTNFPLQKILPLMLILTLITFTLTGCADADGIENLAYVTAIGFDIGENNLITLTFQFAKLVSTDQSGSSQPQQSELISVDCSSFDSGLAIVNSYVSKKVNLSHCKIIVFSEAFAVNGISSQINILTSNIEIRPDCSVFISKSLAKEFLKDSVPTLTNLTPRYYEILLNSQEYTGFSDNTPLWKFFINMRNDTTEAVGVLCGITATEVDPLDKSRSLMEKDVTYKAGETPLSGKTLSQDMGLAVFSSDKLVGELNAIECVSYLILSNSLNSCNISIPDQFENNSTINVRLELNKKTNNEVKLVNSSPYITTNISLNGSITSISLNSDYSKIEHLDTIEEYVESYINSNVSSFLYKTAKYFKADIVGFGRDLIPKYLTMDEWKKIKWSSLYKDSFFKVNVDVKIKSGSLFVKN